MAKDSVLGYTIQDVVRMYRDKQYVNPIWISVFV